MTTEHTKTTEPLATLFADLGRQLGESIAVSFLSSVRAQLPALRNEIASTLPSPFVSPTVLAPVSRTEKRIGVTGKELLSSDERGARVAKALNRSCPFPSCTNPGTGPRYSFLCKTHRDIPAQEREKYRMMRADTVDQTAAENSFFEATVATPEASQPQE